MKFPHRVVAITGASSGIGAELAAQLGAMGCTVGLMARRQDVLDAVGRKVESAGGTPVMLPCDVGDYEQVKRAVARLVDAHGPIDCMIANAGTGCPVNRLEFSPEATEAVFRTNLLGMTNAFYAVLPAMLERKRGHLVGVSSLASYQGMPQDAGYAASKAAQRIHLEGMRVELRGTGVDVTTICPGFIRTPMTDKNEFDMPVLLDVETAARRMIRAIAKRKRVYNFPRRLWWLIRIGMATPRWVYDTAVANRFSRMGASGRTQKRSTEL
ncbi:MAG: SDR family NAD(P)-dependent oxidoreductase [Planctomycetes bacterium]|nr:SDR family NAD(P)-dependent oxidoreductase [Planctomycetota bacterium]